MASEHNPTNGVEGVAPSGVFVPDELLAANHRLAARRAMGSRGLQRARARRRLLPAALIASATMIGAGLAEVFVSSTITAAPPSIAAPGQSSTNARTLAVVARALAADRRTLAAISASTSNQIAALSTGPATTSPALATSSAAPAPVIVAPPAAASAPATHTTTGASGVAIG